MNENAAMNTPQDAVIVLGGASRKTARHSLLANKVELAALIERRQRMLPSYQAATAVRYLGST